jgi:hypothetical protein
MGRLYYNRDARHKPIGNICPQGGQNGHAAPDTRCTVPDNLLKNNHIPGISRTCSGLFHLARFSLLSQAGKITAPALIRRRQIPAAGILKTG